MKKESFYNHYIDFNGENRIYNGMSKASITTQSNKNFKEIMDCCDEKMIKLLQELGLIIDENESELATLEYLFNKSFFNTDSFLNIVLVPGLNCNFKCPYCFENVGECSLFRTDPKKYFLQLKKFSKQFFGGFKDIEISLFGGEPLLFKKYFYDYFDFLKKELPQVSFFSSIVTNGSLLDIETAKRLLSYNIRSIQVTIDGWRGEHDTTRIFKDGRKSYDLLVQNINEVVPILTEDCQFNLRINLNSVTVEQVKNTLSDINPKVRSKIKVLFRPIYNTNCYKKDNSNKFYELKPFLDLARVMGFDIVRNTYYFQACESCSGDNFFFIMPDLTLWKCINDIKFKNAMIGKISEDGSPEFDANKLLKWYAYSNCFKDEKCVNCKKLPDCFGGCVLYKAKNGQRSCKEFEMAALPYLY